MSEKVLKFYRGEVKGVNEEEKTLEAVISTINEDRDGDVILPKAFEDMLGNYRKHPVLLANHDYYDLRSQIGEAVDVIISEKEVRARFKYLAGLKNADGSPMNPQADYAWELAKRGLASYSVGFIGHEWETLEKLENGQRYISGRKFTKVELMEVSQVLIPSNRQALQASADLCEMAIKSYKDEPKQVVKEKKSSEPSVSADGKEPDAVPATENKEPDKAHYSQAILGDEDLKSISEPDKVSIEDTIKQSIKEIIGG